MKSYQERWKNRSTTQYHCKDIFRYWISKKKRWKENQQRKVFHSVNLILRYLVGIFVRKKSHHHPLIWMHASMIRHQWWIFHIKTKSHYIIQTRIYQDHAQFVPPFLVWLCEFAIRVVCTCNTSFKMSRNVDRNLINSPETSFDHQQDD